MKQMLFVLVLIFITFPAFAQVPAVDSVVVMTDVDSLRAVIANQQQDITRGRELLADYVRSTRVAESKTQRAAYRDAEGRRMWAEERAQRPAVRTVYVYVPQTPPPPPRFVHSLIITPRYSPHGLFWDRYPYPRHRRRW